jgi:transposase-like protein
VLVHLSFAALHRAEPHSTTRLERLNGDVKRRTEAVGIFPTEAASRRPVGAIPLAQNDEWAVQRARYMKPERVGSVSDDPLVCIAPVDG